MRHTAPLPHTFRKLEKLLSLGRNSSWRPHLRSSHHCHDHWCSFISRVNLLFTALCRIYAISATCLSLPYPLLSRKLPSICMLLQASITEFLYWAGRHVFWHGLTTLSKPCPLAWLFPNPLICCTAIKLPTAGRPAADNLSRIVSPPPTNSVHVALGCTNCGFDSRDNMPKYSEHSDIMLFDITI